MEELLRRMQLLEQRGAYQPRVGQQGKPIVIQGPTVTTGAPTIAMRGSQPPQQQQQQQIIVRRRGRPKKKHPLVALRKLYAAQRRVTFKEVNKVSKERHAAFKKASKERNSKGDHRKAVAGNKKGSAEKLRDFKKGFPAAAKLKEVATIQSLIAKLKKPSF